MAEKVENRTDWVDYGKGIGIILVVYAHLLSSGYHAGLIISEDFFRLSDSFVYSFHMPLFFFLSGLFIEKSLQKRGGRGYFIDRFWRIAYPYFIWSLLQVAVEVIFSTQTQRGANIQDLSAVWYKPWGQFWFLYALLIMHLVYSVFSRFRIILLIVSLALFLNPLNISSMALSGFSIHFLFFICGMLMKDLFISLESVRIRLWMIFVLILLFLYSCFCIFGNIIEPVRLASGSHPFYFLYLSALGILTSILLSQYLAKKNKLGLLKVIGIYSLPIFLAHMLAGVATRIVLIHVFAIQNWIIHILTGVAVALIAPIFLYRIGAQLELPYLFEAPFRSKASRARDN